MKIETNKSNKKSNRHSFKAEKESLFTNQVDLPDTQEATKNQSKDHAKAATSENSTGRLVEDIYTDTVTAEEFKTNSRLT